MTQTEEFLSPRRGLPPTPPRGPEWLVRGRQTLRKVGGRFSPAVWVNLGLVAVLIIGSVAAWFLVRHKDSGPTTPLRTALVSTGSVTATVTGSGNTESSVSTAVNFPTAGTVTTIHVKAGDTVKVGQVLASIDATSAKQTLTNAKASLANAQAAYDLRTAGQTANSRRQDAVTLAKASSAVTVAQTSLSNAQAILESDTKSLDTAIANARAQRDSDQISLQTAVSNAQEQLDNDRASQDTAVSNAQTQLTNTTNAQNTAVSNAQASYDAAQSAYTSCQTGATAVCDTQKTARDNALQALATAQQTRTSQVSSAQNAVTSAQQTRDAALAKDEQAVTTAQQNRDATLQKDEQAITTAEQNKDATLLKDQQNITTAKQNLTTAQQNLSSSKLTAQANAKPYTAADIASARQNLVAAQITLAQAQTTYEGTTLEAPLGGTVLAVNGKVGQSSNSTSSSTSTSSGSASAGSAASGSSSGTSTSSSAFIEIANPSTVAVTADIAEADAKSVELGQKARITFSATNETAEGTVTQISPESTVSNNVVLYPVTVSLTSVPDGAKLGATVSVSITTGSADGVLTVPSSAVTTVGNTHTVTVLENGAQRSVQVEVGLAGDSGTEITSGLTEGQTVVLGSSTTSPSSNGIPGLGAPNGGGPSGAARGGFGVGGGLGR